MRATPKKTSTSSSPPQITSSTSSVSSNTSLKAVYQTYVEHMDDDQVEEEEEHDSRFSLPRIPHLESSADLREGEPEHSVMKIWLWNRTSLLKLLVFMIIITAIIIAFAVFRVEMHLGDLLEWIDDHKWPEGALIFIAIYLVATILFVPGAILTLGAGYIFRPLPYAIGLVWVGASLGMIAAFILGRFMFRDAVGDWARKRPRFAVIDRAVAREGGKIIFMLRLAPVLPFNAFNYIASVLSVSFRDYTISSCTGIIPGTAMFCYFGSLAHDIQDIEKGNTGSGGRTTTIIIAVVSGVLIIGAVVFTTIIAKRALRRAGVALAQEEADEEALIRTQQQQQQQQEQA